LEVMKRLREAKWRKRPEGWRNKTWMLHHDDLHAHTTCTRRLSFSNCPLLSRFGLCGLLFSPEVEIHSDRSLISDDRRDRRKFTMGPMCYPTKRIQNWKKRKRCIDSGGEYFEGDKSY
jgi:hypothetical protein